MAVQAATEPNTPAQDEAIRKTELAISRLLRGGVALSILLVLVGSIVTFAHHPDYLTKSDDLAGLKVSNAFPTTIPAMVRGLRHFEGPSIVMAGLLVLVATPVARVAASIVAFSQQKDRAFVIITSIVLTLLLTSLVLGKAGG
jgi:uncharacterized membrane protein